MIFVGELIAAIFARIAALGWLAQWTPAIAWVIEKLYDGDLKADVYKAVVKEVAARTGMTLDENDPLSDASLAGAVGEKMGIQLRSLKNVDTIKEDVDYYVVGIIQQKTGYQIRSLLSASGLREDLQQIAAAELSNSLGIPAGVFPGPGEVFDPVKIREQLVTWAKAEFMTQVEGEIQGALSVIEGSGDVQAMAQQLNMRLSEMGSAENVTARQIAVRVASSLATKAVVDYQKLANMGTKRGRRLASLRAAQKKFRAVHGNRQHYVPLGMGNPSAPPTV